MPPPPPPTRGLDEKSSALLNDVALFTDSSGSLRHSVSRGEVVEKTQSSISNRTDNQININASNNFHISSSAPSLTNTSGFLMSSSTSNNEKCPIWKHPSYLDLHTDLLDDKTKNSTNIESIPAINRMLDSIRYVFNCLLMYPLDELENEQLRYSFKQILFVLEDSTNTEHIAPTGSSDPNRFFLFLANLLSRIKALRTGDVLMIPTLLATEESLEHSVLLIVKRVQMNTEEDFTVAIVNTWAGEGLSGGGLQYHGANVDNSDATITRNIALELPDIPNWKLLSSSFWYISQ